MKNELIVLNFKFKISKKRSCVLLKRDGKDVSRSLTGFAIYFFFNLQDFLALRKRRRLTTRQVRQTTEALREKGHYKGLKLGKGGL